MEPYLEALTLVGDSQRLAVNQTASTNRTIVVWLSWIGYRHWTDRAWSARRNLESSRP